MSYARILNSQVPFQLYVLVPMRVGFVAGVWALATIYHDWRTYTAEPISQADTTLLRSELVSTRQLLEDLREHQSHCDWRVWLLSWSLWLFFVADCAVLLWATRNWWGGPRFIIGEWQFSSVGWSSDVHGGFKWRLNSKGKIQTNQTVRPEV